MNIVSRHTKQDDVIHSTNKDITRSINCTSPEPNVKKAQQVLDR